jgi:ABC-type multidrug transport system ATPase subunit
MCHRVAILDKGRLVKLGKTEDLLISRDRYEVVARRIPPDAFQHSQRHNRDGQIAFIVPAACQREALERVWALGGEVLSVNPMRRTLEEVFLELTNKSEDG